MVRILLVSGVLLAGLLYLLLIREPAHPGSSSAASSENSAAEQGAGAGKTGDPLAAPLRMRADPSTEPGSSGALVVGVPVEKVRSSLAEAFDQESATSDATARERDKMIRGVVAELRDKGLGAANIVDLECRTQHCRLRLRGDDQEQLMRMLDAMQDERGFLGKAQSMMLSRDADTIGLYLGFGAPSELQAKPVD